VRRAAWRYGACVGLFAYLILLIVRVLRQCSGEFSYALDDAYVHMGLARHLAEGGIWGVGDGFASASSSIAWPAALALVYWIKGPDLYTPLVFEGLGVAGLMALVFSIVKRDFPVLDRREWPASIAFLAVALAAPVSTLVLGGLEHIWHLLAVLIVVDRAALVLAKEGSLAHLRRAERELTIVAPLLTVVRFESLALVPVLVGLLLVRQRWVSAVALASGASVPVLALGWWSQAQGGFFWPNSVVLKAIRHAPGQDLLVKLGAIGNHLISLLPLHPGYLGLLALGSFNLALVVVAARTMWTRPALVLGCFLVQALAHAAFGAFGWLFRYEAYVLALGVFANLYALAWLAGRLPSIGWSRAGLKAMHCRTWLIGLTIGALAAPTTYCLALRCRDATRVSPRASRNIFEQQVQFGRFLARFYPHARVALNDIGAVSYLSDVHLLDLFGLGSNAVARARVEAHLDVQTIARLGGERDLDLAIVYESWFVGLGGLPPSWTKVGEWEIRGNVVCGSPVVAFYAVRSEHVEPLQRNLAAYSESLPRQVIQRGSYLKYIEGLPASGGNSTAAGPTASRRAHPGAAGVR